MISCSLLVHPSVFQTHCNDVYASICLYAKLALIRIHVCTEMKIYNTKITSHNIIYFINQGLNSLTLCNFLTCFYSHTMIAKVWCNIWSRIKQFSYNLQASIFIIPNSYGESCRGLVMRHYQVYECIKTNELHHTDNQEVF